MYRRGPYYRPKRYFPLFPRETATIAVALVIGAAGLYSMAGHTASDPQELAARANNQRQAQRQRDKRQQTTVTPQAMIGAVATGALTAIAKNLDLSDPTKKEIAMRLVSSAENSSLDWRSQFAYIEDIDDGRGYTAGIIGFCSGTGDMLELVQAYTKTKADNVLAAYLPALRKVNGSDSHAGLGDAFVKAWKAAANDPLFQKAQESERDRVYFNPALKLAKTDGLSTLGQFAYYDAAVMHGPDAWGGGMPDLRARALAMAKTPAQGGDEKAYLKAFLDVRKAEMSKESAHRNVSRIDDAQLAFLKAGNLGLNLPLDWKMYGDDFTMTSL